MAENINLAPIATLQNSSILSTINANNTLIENAFVDCLSIAGNQPNAMQSNLDMDGNQIVNLPAPSTLNSPVRLVDLQNLSSNAGNSNSSIVNVGDFGLVSDAVYTESPTFGLIATSDGSNVLTTASTAFLKVGMNITNGNWHSFAAAAIGSAGVIPAGTTVISFVPNTSITISNPVVTASNFSIVCWSEVLTGTDNTAAIQSALDYAMQNGISEVQFPSGKYLISDTLNVGWGNSFYELHLLGTNRACFDANSLPGVTIYSTKTDRPMINIAGGRLNSIKGISLIGRNRTYVEFAQQFTAGLFSSDPLDWIAPNINPVGNGSGGIASTAPYAAITIDAYAAAQPTIHYPTRNFPSWTGLNSNYNSGFKLTSDTLIEDCLIQGFGVAVASGLVTNNQGDFMKFNRLVLGSCAYGLSLNNTQNRNVAITNINYAGFHTLISGTNLGGGTGEFVGPWDNIGGGGSYQSFDFQNMGFCGPLIISNHYFEGQTRIGNFIAAQSFSSTVRFNGGKFHLANTNNVIPSSYIGTGQFTYLTLHGVEISGAPRITNLVAGGGSLNVDGGTWATATASNTSNALIQAVNYCGGYLFGDLRFNQILRNFITVKNVLATSFASIGGGIGSRVLDDEVNFRESHVGVQTRIPMTQCMKRYTDTFGRQWRMSVTKEESMIVASWGSGPTYVNDQMSFTWPQANQESADVMQNLAVGDMLLVLGSMTIFVITAVGVLAAGFYPITTLQQNNLLVDVSNNFVANQNSTITLTGPIIIIKTGVVIPSVLEYGAFTSGSPNVITISDGSGTSHMANNYVNGDLMIGLSTTIAGAAPYAPPATTVWPIAAGSTLSAVTDGSPGSLILSKNALSTGTFPIFPYELR